MTGTADAVRVVLYSRARCHLCDRARAVLAGAGIAFADVDVDTDAQLKAEYGRSVPVVEVGGIEVFRAGMDAGSLPELVEEGASEAARRDAQRRGKGVP